MEIIWLTEKVIDDRDVITHIDWTATARQGVHMASRNGMAELPPPDPALVEAYLRQPTAEQLAAGIGWVDLPDPPGFKRPEWIERDTLHPWLFAIIDRSVIEQELITELRQKQEPSTQSSALDAELERALEEDPADIFPDPSGSIPSEFRELKHDSETTEQFTDRMRDRWQTLQHYRIDGSKPTGSRALPDMTAEERDEMADLEARNTRTRWLG